MKAAALGLVLALGAGGLSACQGFTPLYATTGLPGSLAAIDIVAPEGRTAYLLRESLDDALGRRPDQTPLYRLTYTVQAQRDPRGLGPDNAASRYELSLKVAYSLKEIAGGGELKSGETEVFVTYGAASDPYAGVSAQSASEERAATEAAQRIRTDIAEYFASHPRS